MSNPRLGDWIYINGLGWVHKDGSVSSQPPPIKNNNTAIVDLVTEDLLLRKKKGIETYGIPLQAGNGRDALQDLYEELLDACCYLKQAMEERNNALHNSRTS